MGIKKIKFCKGCGTEIPKRHKFYTTQTAYRCKVCWATNYNQLDWSLIQKKALKERLKRAEIIERLKKNKNKK